MASTIDVYSFMKDTFGIEVIGQGKNGTYDTVHLYIDEHDDVRVEELIGRKAEIADWYKIFKLTIGEFKDAIIVYNNNVISSDRIKFEDIQKAVKKEIGIDLTAFILAQNGDLSFDFDGYAGVYMAFLGDLIFSYAPIEEEDLSGWQISNPDGELYHYDNWENKSDKEIVDSVKQFENLVKKYTNDHYKEIIDDFHKHAEV